MRLRIIPTQKRVRKVPPQERRYLACFCLLFNSDCKSEGCGKYHTLLVCEEHGCQDEKKINKQRAKAHLGNFEAHRRLRVLRGGLLRHRSSFSLLQVEVDAEANGPVVANFVVEGAQRVVGLEEHLKLVSG